MQKHTKILILAAGLGAGFSLTSCVDPYGSTTVTTYSTGRHIDTLPRGHRTEIVGGTTYYNHQNRYYRRENNGYVTVSAPF